MAKTITKLLSQKPQWVGVDEPVSGSTNPLAQDSTVLPDGTIVHNVEGVDNRCLAQLWGSIKLLTDIHLAGHSEDGEHQLTAADIVADAEIQESKIDLEIYDQIRPDTGTPYQSTNDIHTLINNMYPYTVRSLRNAQFDYAEQFRNRIALDKVMPTSWDKVIFNDIIGNNNIVEVADNNIVWISGYRLRLNGTFSQTTKCLLDITEASGKVGTPTSMSDQGVITLEIWVHNVTESGFAFPYGNIQYRNCDRIAAQDNIPFQHTSILVPVTDPTFDEFVSNPDNNVFYNNEAEIIQIVYCFQYTKIDYSLLVYKTGIDDAANYRTFYNNLIVKPSLKYLNCWETIDNNTTVVATPIVMICRRNMGVYHEAVNPAGTVFVRTGQLAPTFFGQCFQVSRMAYYDTNGIEVPNYVIATYDADLDTYSHLGITYYRSGLEKTTKTAFPLNYFVDVIYKNDTLDMRRVIATEDKALYFTEQKMYAGQLETQLMPTIYGTIVSTNKAVFYNREPYQILGFGSTESEVFGTNNYGGLFMDKANNNDSAVVDEARRCWVDHEVILPVSFSFTEGQSNDESKPTLSTYEPISGTISLNTTGLTATPPIYNFTPILKWANGNTVQLSQTWTGLGSMSASCVVNPVDKVAHVGQRIYGICKLFYRKGSGTPFKISNPIEVKSLLNVKYPIMDSTEISEWEIYKYKGFTGITTTGTVIEIDSNASNVDNYYAGMYAYFLNIGLNGTYRKIISYEAATRELTLETALPSNTEENTPVSIAYLTPEVNGKVIINKLSRGVNSGLKRKRFVANQYGVVTVDRFIRNVYKGTIEGGVVTGLAPGEAIDVIYDFETPFNAGFKVYFTHKPQFTQFLNIDPGDTYEVIKVGNILTTNIGTANSPNEAYLLFMPNYYVPNTDNVRWVGTLDSNFSSNITYLKQIAWKQIVVTEGLEIEGNTMTVIFDIGEGFLNLSSPTTITDPSSSVFIASLLVKSKLTGRYFIMVSLRYKGDLGFTSTNNVYLLETHNDYAIFTN